MRPWAAWEFVLNHGAPELEVGKPAHEEVRYTPFKRHVECL